jgi:hypothetical protein
LSSALVPISAKLAGALRNMPCTCRKVDSWPIFANAGKAKTCARCEALELYDAHTAIVQTPQGSAKAVEDGERR